MNKKYINLLLLLLILGLFLSCLCLTKIENFDNLFSDSDYQFSQITYNEDINMGFNSHVCKDNKNWKKGDKNCLSYFFDKSLNCSDIGDDGSSANNSCPVSCGKCPDSVVMEKIKTVEDKLSENNKPNALDNEFNYIGIYDKLSDVELKINEIMNSRELTNIQKDSIITNRDKFTEDSTDENANTILNDDKFNDIEIFEQIREYIYSINNSGE